MKLKLVIFCIFLISGLSSQVTLKINLIDQNKKPVSFAVIKYKKQVSNSNEDGYFRIYNYVYGSNIYIKKTGFIDTTLVFKPVTTNRDSSVSLYVILLPKITLLDEIPIYSNRFSELNARKSDFIMDYELGNDFILELLSNDNLLVYDNQHQVRSTLKSLPKTENISRDPFGNINIITNHFAHKIQINNFLAKIDSAPVSLTNFNWAIKYCDEAFDSTYFIRRYKDINQTVAFFAVSPKKTQLLKKISNYDKKIAVKANARKVNSANSFIQNYSPENVAGVMGEINADILRVWRHTEFAVATQQAIYELPPYNILKLINDSIYIFAHDIDTLFTYDKKGILLRSQYIDYHHLRYWNKELIVNEEKTKVYAKLLKGSKILLAEINLTNGQLILPFFKIESDNLPKKIKIKDNTVYFMAKQRDNRGYTIYFQNLQLYNPGFDDELIADISNAAQKQFNAKDAIIQKKNSVLLLLSTETIQDTLSSVKSKIYFKKALLLKEKKDYEDALKYFEKAIKLNPDFTDAWFNCGLIYVQIKKFKTAIGYYNKVIELDSNYNSIYQNRGIIKYNLKDFDGAIKDYLVALKYSKNNASLYFDLARTTFELKNYDTTIYYYSQAIKINPVFWQAYYQRGLLNFNLKKTNEALNDYTNAITLNTTNKLLYLQRGITYDELKEHSKAIQDFHMAIKIDSLFKEAYIYAGNSFSEIGDFETAILKFNTALRLDPNNLVSYYNRATCEYKLKKYSKSIADYSSVLKLNSDYKKAYYFRGLAELEAGMKNEACIDFEKAGNTEDAVEKVKGLCK